MATTTSRPPMTHKAWAYRREGRKHGRLLECGSGRFDDKNRNMVHVVMDRLPIGSWSGYIILSPAGGPPPAPEPPPGETDDTEETDDTDE